MTTPEAAPWRRHLAPILAAAALAGCSSGAHSAASTPGTRDLYAQATCVDSETCCLQRNPGNPAACGLTAAEAAAIMAAATGAAGTHSTSTAEYDDSHNASLPDWKRRCIRLYGDCQEEAWAGKKSCFACFESCTGQHEWPFDQCGPKGGRR